MRKFQMIDIYFNGRVVHGKSLIPPSILTLGIAFSVQFGFAFGLVYGLIFGLALGLVISLIFYKMRIYFALDLYDLMGLALSVITGSCWGLSFGLGLGLSLGFTFIFIFSLFLSIGFGYCWLIIKDFGSTRNAWIFILIVLHVTCYILALLLVLKFSGVLPLKLVSGFVGSLVGGLFGGLGFYLVNGEST